MAAHVAYKASRTIGGQLRVVYRHADNSTRTVTLDPVTKERFSDSDGTATLDGNGNPVPTWWNG